MNLRSVLWLSALVACATPHEEEAETTTQQPVWNNGDFENDAIGARPSGWTRGTNYNPGLTDTRPSPQTLASLNLQTGGNDYTYVVGGATETQTDPDVGSGGTLRYPKYGQRAVRVNYQSASANGASNNSNTVRQQMLVSQGDVDPTDDKVHVRFALAPVLQNPGHGYTDQPYYFVRLQNLTKNTTLYSDFNASGQAGVPWKNFTDSTGQAAQYTDWQLVDISPGNAALAVGDQVELTVIATGCAAGGHWGRVYLDSVGSGVPGLYTWGTGPQQANAGSDIVYSLNYKNGGTNTTSGTKLDFVTPPDTTFQSVSAVGCTTPAVGATGTISCPLGTIGQGGTGGFTVTVNVPGGTANGTVITNGNYSIYATGVSALVGPKVQTTVTSGVQYADASITLTDGVAALAWGQSTQYTMVASNAGPLAMTGTVALPLPTNAASMTWSCDAGGTPCGSGTGAINEAVSLASGASQTYTIDVTLNSGSGNASSVATASISVGGGKTDPDSSGNTAVDTNSVGTLRTLAVTNTKPAAGTVVSSPSSISCGSTCSGQFLDGTTVVLTATPNSGATFSGWTGACAGASTTCNVTMAGAQSVTAAFAGAPAGATSTTAGGTQTATVSTAFASPLAITVRDADGTPIPGLTVTYAAPGSGASASLSSASAVTNASGTAQITATANATAGSYNVSVTIPGVASPLFYTLTNVGLPSSITLISGTPQSRTVGTAYAGLAVIVRDAASYPLNNITVAYARPGSGASITGPTTATTDASGTASLIAPANTVAGAFTVTASVSGVAQTVPFSLTNTAGSPASVAIMGGDNQQRTINTLYTQALDVVVRDSFSNVVPGATVAFTAPSSGASAALSAAAATGSNGRTSVQATANSRAGAFVVTASSGAGTTDFHLTNLAGAPTQISLTAGDAQQAVVATQFATGIEVLVRDVGNNPVPNATVSFTAPAQPATASLSHASRQTGSDGKASITATASQKIGSYAITAGIPAQSIQVALENTHDVPATVAAAAASTPQNTTVTQAFAQPLAVRVADQFDNPVPSAVVSFEVPATGASTLVAASMTTDASGLASEPATANTIAGAYSVLARVAGVPQAAAFSLTNIAGAPSTLEVVGSASQSTVVDTAFAAPLVVRVRDQHANVVPGATVNYAVPAADASAILSASTAMSDGSGLANVGATANTVSGTYDVVATLAGAASPVAFPLTNRAGAPASITVDALATPQAARVATGFQRPLGVTVRDQFSNGVPQIAVTWAAPASGATASLVQSTATTGATGHAQIAATAGTVTGSYAVTASIAGGLSDEFSLQNLQGEPAQVSVIVGGSSQSTVVNTAFSDALVVEVRDEYANVVVGTDVSFTAPASGPSAALSSPVVATDAAGHAQVTAHANTVSGTYGVVASASAGAAPVEFSLANTADVPASITADAQTASQSAEVKHAFAQPLAVTVRDQYGNGVPNVSVAYAGPAFYVSFSQPSATTGVTGRASIVAIASQVATAYQVTASVDSSIAATFSLENTSAAPGSVLLVSGGGQHARATAAFAEPVVALIVDAFGNAVPNVDVAVSMPTAGPAAKITVPMTKSDAQGYVTTELEANDQLGDFLLTFRAQGVLLPLSIPMSVDAIPTTTTATAGEMTSDKPLAIEVSVGAAVGTAAGKVELLEGDLVIATATLEGGKAVITAMAPPPGKRTYRVRFAAQGMFGASASSSVTVEIEEDSGSLSGGSSGGCSTSGGQGSWLLVLGAALFFARRRRAAVLGAAALAAVVAPKAAQADDAGTRSIDRLHAASADSEWIAGDSLGFEGHREVSIEVLNDYAYRPLVAYDGAGNERGVVVEHSYIMQVGASVSIANRYRLSATVPFSVYQAGNDTMFNGTMLRAPQFGFGDITLAGDVRIIGDAHSPLRIAAGVRFGAPTGSDTNYMSDDVFTIEPRLMVAGGIGHFEYAAMGGILLREETQLAGQPFGGELRGSVALGARFGKLLVGPELVTARSIEAGMTMGNPTEAAIGASYEVDRAWRLGLGASMGLSNAVGVPDQRALLSLTWLRR